MIKAFLGTGHLGAAFVQAMGDRGEKVQIWNRTFNKANVLSSEWLTAFEVIDDAVAKAGQVHLALSDDNVVDAVLDTVIGSLSKGTIIIDHSTVSPGGVILRTEKLIYHGLRYLHAPVLMGPHNARQGTGNMLISGDQATIEAVRAELAKMTGRLINVGSEVGKAAKLKLIGNHLLILLTMGMADTLSLAGAIGVSNGDVLTLFKDWNPGDTLPKRFEKIAGGDFQDANWTLNMARKDAKLTIDAADTNTMVLLPKVLSAMDQLIEAGYSEQDWNVLANFRKLKKGTATVL